MATTSPDNIQYPVSSDQVAPLASHFQNLADTTQAALNNKASATEVASIKQTSRVYVKNGSTALTKGTPVYISSADGTNIIVSASSNATEATSSKTLGLLETDLAINATGYVVTDGKLSNIDTSGAGAAGDAVWLGVNGAKLYGLANKPVAPAHMVYLGVVSRKSATVGEIQVKVQNGFELDELHNVLITSPADKQVLAYESSTQLWKNKQATGGVTVGATAPAGPNPGDAWFDSNDGTLYVWYVDADTSQWVQVQANSALEGTILARLGALESQAIAYGNRQQNKIINGDFDINQRGLTSTGQTTPGYGFDRWLSSTGGDGTVTYQAQTFTPGTAPVAGYEAANYARIITSGQTTAAAQSVLQQSIEDVRTLAGQTVTVSFWAKAASGTPKIAVELSQYFGTIGGSTSGTSTQYNNYFGQVTLSTSWQRYTVTGTVASILGKTIGTDANSSSLKLNLWTSAGSNFNTRINSLGIQSNTFDFWGVQVEPGTVATAFRTATGSKQGELAACQRYYQRFKPALRGVVGTGGTSCWRMGMVLPVQMRIAPGGTWVGTGYIEDSGGTGTFTALGTSYSSTSVIEYDISITGTLTAGRAAVQTQNGTAYIELNAEF